MRLAPRWSEPLGSAARLAGPALVLVVLFVAPPPAADGAAPPWSGPNPRAGGSPSPSGAPGPSTARERGERILRRSVAAHGGLRAYRAVRDWKVVAERNLEAGSEVRHEIYREYLLRSGGRTRTLLVKERREARLIFGHDGESGFMVVDGELRTDPPAAAEAYYRAHGEYYLRSLPFKWLDDGMEATHLGRERSGSRWLQLVRITATSGVGRAPGDVWVAAIDVDTGLLAEARLDHDRAGQTWVEPPPEGRSRITYAFSDHRTVDGLRIPFRMEYVADGVRTGENLIRRFEIDVGLSTRWFRPEAHVGAAGDRPV